MNCRTCFTLGKKFRITLSGASHENTVGVTIEGLPAGVDLCGEDFEKDLSRRRPSGEGTTARVEDDKPEFEGGMLKCVDGSFVTDGKPLTIKFANRNIRPEDYDRFAAIPRPGHADFTSMIKYGRTFSGGGIFSGRMTLPIVAAGVVAKQIIAPARISARLTEIGGVKAEDEEAVSRAIRQAEEVGDSLGGVVECRCSDIPAGLGEPFFDSIESVISHAMFSIPGIRGVEFGDGFGASRMKGSEHNDPITDIYGTTARNGCGGVNGGISNGNDIVFRVAVKPTSSISKPQKTFDFEKREMAELKIAGRHDTCFALRVPPVVEALAACVLADFLSLAEN